MDLSQEGHEVLEGAAKAIYRPRRDHVELASCCSLEHAVEGWASVAVLGPANAVVAELLHDLPAPALSHGQQLAALVLNALAVCGNARVERNTLRLGQLTSSR